MAKKTDNANIGAKLDLRRYFLGKYHSGGADVLDCCQGSGKLWHTLREEFPVDRYWGIDVKPKKGRIRLESERLLAQRGWPQNVVDIDTYGSPWKHWLSMLPNVSQAITVFLTIGQVKISGSPLQRVVRSVLGIGNLPIPNAIGAKLNEFAASALLTSSYDYDILLAEAVEAVSGGNARYIGVRLEPARQ